MDQDSNRDSNAWTDGVSHFAEAARLNVTASRLAIAGIVAMGAAATAYLWDAQRRNNLIDTTKRWTDQLASMTGSAMGKSKDTPPDSHSQS